MLMKKRVIIVIILCAIMLTGCVDLHLKEVNPFLHVDIKNINASVYIDLSEEEWNINQYNGKNLFKKDGIIFFKDYYRIHKINGYQSELYYKLKFPTNLVLLNDNMYLYNIDGSYGLEKFNESASCFNKESAKDIDELMNYNLTSISEYLVANNRGIVSRYENKYYYISEEENYIYKIYEYNSDTNEYKFIKNLREDTLMLRMFHDDKYTVILECISNGQDKDVLSYDESYTVMISVYNNNDYDEELISKEFTTFDMKSENIQLNYYNHQIYLFELLSNEKFIVNTFNIETGKNIVEYYIFDWTHEEFKLGNNVELYIPNFNINIFDDKYFYIVEHYKVSRIDRTTGLVELVFEVVE